MVFDDCIVNGCVVGVQFCCRGNIFCNFVDIYQKQRRAKNGALWYTGMCVKEG